MELYIARHGETLSNAEKRLTGGGTNSPLTEKGIEQAKQLGNSLQNIVFDAVYSSPLKRAVDTVNIAFGGKYRILVDDRLSEIGLGVMEGNKFDDVSLDFPESGMLFFTSPLLYKTPPKGEHLNDMIERIDSFLSDIAKTGHDKIFVLTHGYALRVLYACTVDKSISAIAEAPAYSNCELVHYAYDKGKWRLKQ
jgi:broad specificity phosphatase PhoE